MFRLRLLVATMIGLIGGSICAWYQFVFERGAGDFGWSTRLIRDVLSGINPYSYPISLTPSAYPRTAALISGPLAWVPPELAAGIFIGLSTGLLAMGLTRNGEWWRLLVFLAFPYWQALQAVQWSPLLFAVALYPVLLPLTLAKPHVGLPVALLFLTRRRALACVLFGLASLLLMPTWPLHWLGHQGDPGQYIPAMLILPLGPILLLAALRWRDERARLLFLYGLVPLRPFYDSFMLWLIPRTARELVVVGLVSWLGYFGWFFTMGGRGLWPNIWQICTIWLPMLLLVFRSVLYNAYRAALHPEPEPVVLINDFQ